MLVHVAFTQIAQMSKDRKRVHLGLFDIQGAYDKFPDIFRIGTFIDSTCMKL